MKLISQNFHRILLSLTPRDLAITRRFSISKYSLQGKADENVISFDLSSDLDLSDVQLKEIEEQYVPDNVLTEFLQDLSENEATVNKTETLEKLIAKNPSKKRFKEYTNK